MFVCSTIRSKIVKRVLSFSLNDDVIFFERHCQTSEDANNNVVTLNTKNVEMQKSRKSAKVLVNKIHVLVYVCLCFFKR